MYGKTTRARKYDGKQIGDRAVKIPALQCRITLHRALKRHELNLDPLFRKVSVFCGDNERYGVRVRHESNGEFGEFCVLRL